MASSANQIQDKLIKIFDEVLKVAKENTIIKKKALIIHDTLDANLNELLNFIEDGYDSQMQDQLDNLIDILVNFSKLISDANIQDLLWSSIRNDTKIDKIITDINSCMNDINALLKAIGVANPTKFNTDTFTQDVENLHEFLDDALDKVQRRRKETKQMLNQSANNIINFNNESANAIVSRYKEYEKSKDEFIYINKQQPLCYSDEQCQYYEGIFKEINIHTDSKKEKQEGNDSTGIPITIMELSNNRYLGRILEVLTQLNHPFVESFVGFYNESNEDEEPRIAIGTKRDGINLFDLLHKSSDAEIYRPLETNERTVLSYKIAQAMLYVHSRNVIHRNLTSCSINICYDKNGEIYPVISNFRSSRFMPNKAFDVDMTQYQKNNYNASPSALFAPELYNGSTNYNESIDVFSFAAILYELATGKVPFFDKNLDETKELIVKGERPSLVELQATNKDLADLIENCWKQDPKERYTFGHIMQAMSEKEIIFPQDTGSIVQIKDFYKNNTSNHAKIQNCRAMIDEIKKIIRNSYQYRNELFSIRSFFNNYLIFLNDFHPQNGIDEKTLGKIFDDLESNLQQFSASISRTSSENFNAMAKKMKVNEITDHISDYMKKFNQLMKQLGYSSNECYQESRDDIIFDYNELYNFYLAQRNSDYDSKRREIKKYLDEKKGKDYFRDVRQLSKKLTLKRITGLLSKYNKCECKCFSLKSMKNASNFNDNDDADDNYDEYGKSSNDDKDQGVINREKNSTLYQGSSANGTNDVIIKVFDFAYLRIEENCINLKKEIENMAKVDRKYIVQFDGYAIDNDGFSCNVWLIMESENIGQDQLLKNKIHELSGELKTKIAFKIADIFNHLISKEINYRNITTSSIFIDNENPKLIDLGEKSSNNLSLSFSRILYEMKTGEKLVKEDNFQFNKNEEDKTELEKLIELGFQTNNKVTFEEMYNALYTYKNRIKFED